VPGNGKKWVTLYFTRMSEPTNTEHADSEDWLCILQRCVKSSVWSSSLFQVFMEHLTNIHDSVISLSWHVEWGKYIQSPATK
jgi:hypothetical protein